MILFLSSLFHTGLRFEEIADAKVWHGDVCVFSVFDLISGELLGYFYLDLYTRFGSLQVFTCLALDLFFIYLLSLKDMGICFILGQGRKVR